MSSFSAIRFDLKQPLVASACAVKCAGTGRIDPGTPPWGGERFDPTCAIAACAYWSGRRPGALLDCLLRSIATSPMGASMRLSPLSARIIWSSVTAHSQIGQCLRLMSLPSVPRYSHTRDAAAEAPNDPDGAQECCLLSRLVLSNQDPHTNHVMLCAPCGTHRRMAPLIIDGQLTASRNPRRGGNPPSTRRPRTATVGCPTGNQFWTSSTHAQMRRMNNTTLLV